MNPEISPGFFFSLKQRIGHKGKKAQRKTSFYLSPCVFVTKKEPGLTPRHLKYSHKTTFSVHKNML